MTDMNMSLIGAPTLSDAEISHLVADSVARAARAYKGLETAQLKKVLILPPDYTRLHSYGGAITAMLIEILRAANPDCVIDVMPALGTHAPMTEGELESFIGPRIADARVLVHRWREDVERIGTVPSSFVSEISGGLVDYEIEVELNRLLLDPSYDLIVSVGQVVPHEIAGYANYSKNIFVGCGGYSMINKTHMLASVCGLERVLGQVDSPSRKVFDYAERECLGGLPLVYMLTVTSQGERGVDVHGLFCGRDRRLFEQACALSARHNLTRVPHRLTKVVVSLDEREFKTTWLGNKSIYRTRMAMARGGELVIIGPGISHFGEDPGIDELIRRFGYVGREKVLELMRTDPVMGENLSVASHLIYGSSDGLYSITYCAGRMSKQEVEGVGYRYMPVEDALRLYHPETLCEGFNTLENGERIYYISNPALGLWIADE